MLGSRFIELISIHVWLSGARYRFIALFLAGLGLILAGLFAGAILDHRISERVSTGKMAYAEVVGVTSVPTGRVSRTERLHITYSYAGKSYESWLMSSFGETDAAPGDRIALYVDAQDPTRVAAASGFASEDYYMLMKPASIVIGVVGVILSLIGYALWIKREFGWRKYDTNTHLPIVIFASLDGSPKYKVWAEAVDTLQEAATRAGRNVSSPLRLRLVLQIPGDLVEPNVRSLRVGMYWRKARTLTIYAAPHNLDAEPTSTILALVSSAVGLAERFAIRKNIAKDLFILREVVASLQRLIVSP